MTGLYQTMKTNQNAYCVVFLKNTKTNLYISILCDSSSSGIPFCLRYSFRRTERWYLSPGECFTLNTKRTSKYCSCPCGEYSGVVIVLLLCLFLHRGGIEGTHLPCTLFHTLVLLFFSIVGTFPLFLIPPSPLQREGGRGGRILSVL